MSLTNPPNCPVCGRKMVLRTARSGPHAGNQFYGCTGYPSCKGIVNLTDSRINPLNPSTNQPTHQTSTHNRQQITLPRIVRKKRVENSQVVECRPKGSNLQTRLFQNVHTLPEIVSKINKNRNELNHDHLNAFAQWRLDLPLSNPILDNFSVHILGVMEKILLRGSITFCSPCVEDTIKRIYRFTDAKIEEWMIYFQNVDQHPRSALYQTQFDSDSERKFYKKILPSIYNPEKIYPWFSSQIPTSSLTGKTIDPNSKQRIDFLICKPDCGKYVIEIDGPQHNGQMNTDQLRDQFLSQSGYHVIRITTKQINDNSWKNVPGLIELLDSINENSHIELSSSPILEALLFMKAASQFQIGLLEAIKGGWLNIYERASWKIKIVPPSWINSKNNWKRIIQSALEDFIDLLNNLYQLQNAKNLQLNAELFFNFQIEPTLTLKMHPLSVIIHEN